MTTKMVFHGSDIEKICAYYHLNKEDIVKFGANVNPLGLSASVKKEIAENIDLFSSYPDRDYVSLRNTIAAYCQIPAEFILPGNGSSELISLLIQERAPKHTLILGPTYSEYSRELSFSGSTQEYYHLQEERNFSLDVDDLCKTLEKGYDFLIICNPNNPTSSAIMQEDLRKLIAFCSGKNIFVMIDETYVEFAPDINAVTAVPLTREFTNLMVLRGVSKFYAAPGMRLGYGITGNREFLAKMKEKQTPWSLNSLGAFAGKKMLLDHDYFRRTRELILGERDRMETELKKLPIFKVYPAYANFILLKIQKEGLTSADVFEACIDGTLDQIDLQFADNACVCIVLASNGYPVSYEKGFPIRGLETFKEHEGYYCFHAGTKFKDGEIVTNGGRVLGVTALGDTLKEARANAYKAVDWVDFDNKYYRHDIGKAIDEA